MGLWVLIYNPVNIIRPPGILTLMSLFLSWYIIFKKKYIDNYIKSPMKILSYTLYIVFTILVVNLFNSHFFSEKIYQEEQVLINDYIFEHPDSLSFLKHDMSLLNGTVETYYENGQLDERAKFKNGRLHGRYEMYFKNGQLEQRAKFKNGRINGLHEMYFKSGQIEFESNFKNRQLHGTERVWYENGQIKVESNWENDQYHGIRKEWYKNGQLKLEENYKDGKEEGLWKLYYENGQLYVEGNYKDGGLISEKCWDWFGKEIDCE